MPTYAYECQACGHHFEEFQSMSAGPLRKCPECSLLKLQRLIGPGAGIIFKGGGFYETDYRSDSYRTGQKAEKDGSDSQAKPDPKTEKTPEKAPKKPKQKGNSDVHKGT